MLMPAPERPKLILLKGTGPENNPLSRPLQRIVLRENALKSQARALQRAIDSYEAAQPSPKQNN